MKVGDGVSEVSGGGEVFSSEIRSATQLFPPPVPTNTPLACVSEYSQQ